MKLSPTEAKKTEDFPEASIRAGIGRTFWSFEVREENCRDISVPFTKLYNQLYHKVDTIRKLCRDLNLITGFVVTIHTKCGNIPLDNISRDVVSFASSINADIGIDLYCYDEDDDFDLRAI